MKIIIGAAPEKWTQALEELLKPAGLDLSRYRGEGALPKEEPFLLVYSRPEYMIEAAAAAGGEIHAAIDAWVGEAREFLRCFRQDRVRVGLVHGPSIFEAPHKFCDLCEKRAHTPVELAIERVTAPEADTSIAGVFAAQVVSGSVDVKDLAGELEAASSPLTQDPPRYVPDWGAAYEEIRDIKNTQPLKELEEENELLLLQLHQVQEELESYYLEAMELRGGASSMDTDELLSYAVMLEHQYSKLLKSRTWKLMAPVREVMRLVKSILRRKRVPRNRLPKRPGVLADEPVGGRFGKRTRI
jgi:hypothetical protein